MGGNSHYFYEKRGRYLIYRHKVVCRTEDDDYVGRTTLYDVYDSIADSWLGTYSDYDKMISALKFEKPLSFGKD